MRMKMTMVRVSQLVVLILVLNAQLISNCLSLTSHEVDSSASFGDVVDTGPQKTMVSVEVEEEPSILDEITDLEELSDTDRLKLATTISSPNQSSDETRPETQTPETPESVGKDAQPADQPVKTEEILNNELKDDVQVLSLNENPEKPIEEAPKEEAQEPKAAESEPVGTNASEIQAQEDFKTEPMASPEPINVQTIADNSQMEGEKIGVDDVKEIEIAEKTNEKKEDIVDTTSSAPELTVESPKPESETSRPGNEESLSERIKNKLREIRLQRLGKSQENFEKNYGHGNPKSESTDTSGDQSSRQEPHHDHQDHHEHENQPVINETSQFNPESQQVDEEIKKESTETIETKQTNFEPEEMKAEESKLDQVKSETAPEVGDEPETMEIIPAVGNSELETKTDEPRQPAEVTEEPKQVDIITETQDGKHVDESINEPKSVESVKEEEPTVPISVERPIIDENKIDPDLQKPIEAVEQGLITETSETTSSTVDVNKLGLEAEKPIDAAEERVETEKTPDVEQPAPDTDKTGQTNEPPIEVALEQTESGADEVLDLKQAEIKTSEPIEEIKQIDGHTKNETDDDSNTRSDTIKLVLTPGAQKYCADLNHIKRIFDQHIDPIYTPLIGMLPSEYQLLLMGETQFGGLTRASCIFVSLVMIFLMSVWYSLTRFTETRKVNMSLQLNEQLLAAANKIKRLEFENKTFSNLVADLESRQKSLDTSTNEKDSRMRELEKSVGQLSQALEKAEKELGKSKSNEARLTKELNQAKIDINGLNETIAQQRVDYEMELGEMKLSLNGQVREAGERLEASERRVFELESLLAEKTNRIDELSALEAALREEMDGKENTIAILKSSLVIKNDKSAESNVGSKSCSPHNDTDSDANSDDFVNVTANSIPIDESESSGNQLDLMMKLGKMKMEIKQLEGQLDETKRLGDEKSRECEKLAEALKEKTEECGMLELRKRQLEKSVKESEMQIKLLNELREKDTKQHLKALSEIDGQLKKKSTDADKVSHLLDQIRVKQERIQELESSLSRVERQSNQERQTFEKQTHETWLQSKRIEKELRESRIELATMRDKYGELEFAHKSVLAENSMLKKSADMQNYINQIPHHTNKTTLPAKAPSESGMSEGAAAEFISSPPRPPSTSSNPGGIMSSASYGSIPFIRAPFPPLRFPFGPPPPINPAAAMAFMQHQQQQLEQQLPGNNNSASSSSPSPDLSGGSQLQQQQAAAAHAARMHAINPIMYRMHPSMIYQHQQFMQQQQLKSEVSSQQTSPGSTSFASNPPVNHLLPSPIPNDSLANRGDINQSASFINNSNDNEPKFGAIVEENSNPVADNNSSTKNFDV